MNPEDIDGWMWQHELAWIAEQAKTCMRVAEIGCYRGRSTKAWATNVPPGGVVYAIDTWTISGIRKSFEFNLQPEIAAKRVLMVQDRSEAAFEWLNDGRKFDAVFIDGDHSFDAVQRDIVLYSLALRPGGLMCGHDYDNPYYPGVTRAVKSLIPQVQRGPGLIWWTRT